MITIFMNKITIQIDKGTSTLTLLIGRIKPKGKRDEMLYQWFQIHKPCKSTTY